MFHYYVTFCDIYFNISCKHSRVKLSARDLRSRRSVCFYIQHGSFCCCSCCCCCCCCLFLLRIYLNAAFEVNKRIGVTLILVSHFQVSGRLLEITSVHNVLYKRSPLEKVSGGEGKKKKPVLQVTSLVQSRRAHMSAGTSGVTRSSLDSSRIDMNMQIVAEKMKCK